MSGIELQILAAGYIVPAAVQTRGSKCMEQELRFPGDTKPRNFKVETRAEFAEVSSTYAGLKTFGPFEHLQNVMRGENGTDVIKLGERMKHEQI